MLSLENNKNKHFELTPSQILVISFLLVILIGAILLKQSFALNSTQKISFIDSLFTATSAVCVTGLTVVDINRVFSIYGQIIILFLIQFGGLGIMTIVTFAMSAISERVPLKIKLFAKEDRPTTTIELIDLIKNVFFITIIIELIGAIFLFLNFWFKYKFPFLKALYYSIFHSVSAFCNAGFALFEDNFIKFNHNLFFMFIISLLIILGGIGFTTIIDIIYFLRKKTRYQLSLNTKIVLSTTLILILAGSLIILILEFNNACTLQKMNFIEKVVNAFFQSVTTRTAGFNTIDNAKLLPSTILICLILMFIGASPGGTGGGIKTTTATILFKSIMRSVHDDTQIVIFNKAVPKESISRAIAVFTISTLLVISGVFLLLISENFTFIEILFETVSAFGTVGLSLGITSQLSAFGKFVITLIMFLGRVGSLTVVIALASAKPKLNIKYPEETVLIG